MTVEPVLMLTLGCPLLYPTRLSCVGCCLLFVLCSLCAFFLSFFSSSLQPGTDSRPNRQIFFFFYWWDLAQRFGMDLRMRGCWQAVVLLPIWVLIFSVSNTNLLLLVCRAWSWGLLLEMICLSKMLPHFSSLLAFIQEEITDDAIRVGESEELRNTWPVCFREMVFLC